MFKLALKMILGRKRRLAFSTIVVIAGISFLAGTLMFTDTIQRTFDSLFSDVFKDTDAYVRSDKTIDLGFGNELRERLDAGVADEVAKIDGVTKAAGYIQGFGRVVGKDGKTLGIDQGPPNFISNILPDGLTPWRLTPNSRYPKDGSEVAIDTATAKLGKYEIGDTVGVTSAGGTKQLTLVGTVKFGTSDGSGGGTFALTDLATTQELLGPEAAGKVDAVLIEGKNDLSQQQVVDRVKTGVGTLEVITGKAISEETASQVKRGLSFFTTFLLAFVAIALFVSAFVIYNTFSILVTQRLKETALLRAIGAKQGQIFRSIVAESIVVGLIGSLLGVVAGVGMAVGIKGLLSAFGIAIPTSGLVLLPRTIILSVILGVLMAVVSAVLPAVRAARTAPMAALRDVAAESPAATPGRIISGLAVLVAGAALVSFGLAGKGAVYLIGIAPIFIGLFILGPAIARPIARVIGSPLPKLQGITGTMSRENAMRNPKRTARTAAALLVGVALITGVSVISSSAKASITDLVGKQFTGDFVIEPSDFVGLSPKMTAELRTVPGVTAVSALTLIPIELEGKGTQLVGIDPASAAKVFKLTFASGGLDKLNKDSILVSKKRAAKKNYLVGDTIPATMLDGSERKLAVGGIYNEDELFGAYLVSSEMQAGSGADLFDFNIFTVRDPQAKEADVRAAIDNVAKGYPNAKVRSRQQFIKAQTAQLDQLLALVTALLFLSVVFALFGVVITLFSSIFERTRELGMLRAIGMDRAKVRAMVRWESVITSLLGVVQGIVVGLGLGWAVMRALRDQGLKSFAVPVPLLITFLIAGFTSGVLAGVFPAWRASKIDVMKAISSD